MPDAVLGIFNAGNLLAARVTCASNNSLVLLRFTASTSSTQSRRSHSGSVPPISVDPVGEDLMYVPRSRSPIIGPESKFIGVVI